MMRITPNGNVLIGTSSTTLNGAILQTSDGITFPETQIDSSNPNTLDDYEHGSFTPTIFGSTTAGTGTYNTQVGRYTKVANIVHFNISLSWSAHTGTGFGRVGGLPFTTSSVASHAASIVSADYTTPIFSYLTCQLSINNTFIYLFSTQLQSNLTSSVELDTNVTFLNITGTYRTA